MSTKLDSPPAVEARHGHSTSSISISSTVSASSPKVSMFGAKAGFVIPKNKLSGSLVPIFRGGSKGDSGSMGKEESTKQVQRKTKWGIDLTQDPAVRKGKVLAYQTRMEQITQQLKSGSLKLDEDQGSESPQPSSVNSATNHDDMSQKVECLELERREIIGEILRLNPSYKTPPDYKPLLKESKVPIPIKSYSGYNFIGLLLGPESNTQKRLEEETGAKVRVYGIKSDSAEKREITKSDISEAQSVYEELYVHVSADTYEKVDTAVALIELLLTPVSGITGTAPVVSSSPAANNADHQTANQDSGFSTAPVTMPRPLSLPIRPGQPPFQLYPPTWFPANVPRPSSGFMPPFNPTQFPPLRVPPGTPQYFARPPNISSAPRTSPPVMRPPLLVQLAPRQSSPLPIPQSMSTLRSPGPVNPQIGPPVRPFVPAPVNFSGWGPAPTAPSRPMAPPSSYPSMRPPPPAVPSPPTTSGPPQFNVPGNVFRPPPTNFAPHPTPIYSTQPSTSPPMFSPAPSHIGPVPTPGTASSSSELSMPPPSPTPPPTSLAQAPPSASAPAPASFHPSILVPAPPRMQAPIPLRPPQSLPATPTSSSSTISPLVSSPVTAPKPLRPISGDFTFQPLRTQPPPASPVSHNSGPPFAAPKAPSFRLASQNPVPGATAAPPPSFPAGATNIRPPPPMLQGYPRVTPAQPGAPAIPVSPPSFSRPPPLAYPANFQQANQNQMIHLTRPRGSFTIPIQPMPGNAPPSIGSNQIYDPFSPSASSAAPHQGANSAEVKKPETDSEYEDLMASVGVK